ncbi:MAG: DUF1990 domain-containing protein [Pyrinomonadaceae bacterium]|nr:DUF1990 domain-containing protein [Pyrinomonadaceae bacterium]
MFLLNEPSEEMVASFLAAQQNNAFSYSETGASLDGAPHGYTVDHNRVRLGTGETAFAQAKAAIQSWKMFDLGWCRVYPPDAAIEIGTNVVIVISHFGFWSLNSCRIVYLLETHDGLHKYGFAYGTLAEHGATGEERFTVEWNGEDESVWYDLYAFSRPHHLLAKIGYPLSRMLQKRFARESQMAMLNAVENACI